MPSASRFYMLAAWLTCNGCALAENYLDPDGPRYAGNYAEEPEAASDLPRLKIVTFNIKFGAEYEQAGAELLEAPQLAAADILLLQEMDAPSTDSIAQRLGMNYVYYPGSVHENGRDFGNAVLSRWPLLSDNKLILPHRNPKDGRIRIAVQATIDSPLGRLSVYSVHNETPWLGPRARLDQARSVLDHARSSELASVVAGDFNTSDPGSLDQTVELFRSGGYSWASSGSGDTVGAFTLDHIFIRKLSPLRTGTVSTQASDHRPQWARVEFPVAP